MHLVREDAAWRHGHKVGLRALSFLPRAEERVGAWRREGVDGSAPSQAGREAAARCLDGSAPRAAGAFALAVVTAPQQKRRQRRAPHL
jgi:hypothetical protein